MVIEKAYAKINLTLKVYDKLENGYHTMETLMVPTSLYDELTFEKTDSDDLEIVGMDIKNNSIYNAYKLMKLLYGVKGCKITINKQIPMEAGLGGGSADSSATLRGLNRLFDLNLSLRELEMLAKGLGSDNVFCLYNKAAICRHFGEELEFVNEPIDFKVLLIKPDFGLSTKEVFENLKIIRFLEPLNYQILWDAFRDCDYELIGKLLFNDLLKPALLIKPELKTLMDEIKNLGFKAQLSGSGSTLFVIDKEERLLKLAASLKEKTYLCDIKNTLS